MKNLTILSRIPGSGKSTYAEQFKSAITISSDSIRLELTGDFQNLTQEAEVWKKFENDVKVASFEANEVIADATILSNNLRMHWFNRFKGYFDKVVLVWFNLPFEICWERNLSRPQPVPLGPCANMFRKFEAPNFEVKEHFDEIIEKNE